MQKWMPYASKNKIKKDEECSINKFRRDMIKNITKCNLLSLNVFHPFKVINLAISTYTPFYFTNIDKIKLNYPQIKKRHLNSYYELFYNFG